MLTVLRPVSRGKTGAGRALTSGPPLARCAGSAGFNPGEPPGPRPQGRVRLPSKWRPATATTSSPAETWERWALDAGFRDARSNLAQDGRRETSLSLLPLWLRAARQPSRTAGTMGGETEWRRARRK